MTLDELSVPVIVFILFYFIFYFFIFRYNCTDYLLLFRRTSLLVAKRVVHFYLLFCVMYLCIYLQARRVADGVILAGFSFYASNRWCR